MKLQLKALSGSWWATENRKEMQKLKDQPEGLYHLTRTIVGSHNCCRVVENYALSRSVEIL